MDPLSEERDAAKMARDIDSRIDYNNDASGIERLYYDALCATIE